MEQRSAAATRQEQAGREPPERVDPARRHDCRGHTRVTARAIRSVAAAAAARQLDTIPRRVGVELHDRAGALGILIQAPIAMPAPAAAAARLRAAVPEPTVLERAEAARKAIGERVAQVTGSVTGSVDLRITSAELVGERRVR